MHCEERLNLSTGENKPLLRIILDPPLLMGIYGCPLRGDI